MWRRCRTCRAWPPRPDVKVLQTNELRTIFFAFNLGDALPPTEGREPVQGQTGARGAVSARSTSSDAAARRCAAVRATPARWSLPPFPAMRRSRTSACPSTPTAQGCSPPPGYPNGFAFNLDCMNDGYVNEEEICQAVAAMWSVSAEGDAAIAPRCDPDAEAHQGRVRRAPLGWANEPMIDAYSLLVQVVRARAAPAACSTGAAGDPRSTR